MLQNALDLNVSLEAAVETGARGEKKEIPAWASDSLTAMADNGIEFDASATLTRGEVAQVMYKVCQLAEDAPGMAVIRMQQ
jgi:hypothetical protein